MVQVYVHTYERTHYVCVREEREWDTVGGVRKVRDRGDNALLADLLLTLIVWRYPRRAEA